MTSSNSILDKASIVSTLCSQLGCKTKEGQVIVETILEAIKAKLEHGEAVKLSGFGNFSVRETLATSLSANS